MFNSKTFTTERRGEYLVFKMADVSSFGGEMLSSELAASLNKDSSQPPPKILVDCEHVLYPNSMFLEALVQLSRLAHKAQSTFALCKVGENLRMVLSVSNLDKLWAIYPTADEALAVEAE